MGIETLSWLGVEPAGEQAWRLEVTEKVISGASALFGGCASAAAVAVGAAVTEHPPISAWGHFTAMARLGTTVIMRAEQLSAGRTMSHVEVTGEVDGTRSFAVRAAFGRRPPGNAEGQWVLPPDVAGPPDSLPFDHPVHRGTWAERFEWRLAGTGRERSPWAAWWVRPLDPAPDPTTAAVVLVDYVTYGVGRALGVPMGGLSVDNVVRVHRPRAAEWYLLEVRPETIDGGFGHGIARVYAEGELVATGSQSIVVNDWDWRLPGEIADEGQAAVGRSS